MVDEGVRDLVVDLADVNMVDSSGIGLLISAHNSLRKLGGQLALIHASADLSGTLPDHAHASAFQRLRKPGEAVMSKPSLDDELVQDYLAECREHLATIETDLLAIEADGAEIDEQLVNRVFRAAHSIKGGAGFFDLATIRELAHRTENALDLVRSRQMVPTPEVVSILLTAFDKLRELISSHRESNEADIGEFVSALTSLAAGACLPTERSSLTEQVRCTFRAEQTHRDIGFRLEPGAKGGKCIYLIEYDLIHDIQRQGKTPWEVFKRLIHAARFSKRSSIWIRPERSTTIRTTAHAGSAVRHRPRTGLIGQVVKVPPERVRLIEQNGEARSLSARPAEPEGKSKRRSGGRGPNPADVAPAPKVLDAATSARRRRKRPLKAVASTPSTPAETTIRLNVSLLDSLMTLAGELVLSRNQLNESLSRTDERGIRSGAQRVSLVTSELQEVVTQTRMQPVGGLFANFPRLVRDLARDLGKEVHLKLDGSEVEIDKTILEGLSDPLTHMVRNSVDHGVESPADRIAAGKSSPERSSLAPRTRPVRWSSRSPTTAVV